MAPEASDPQYLASGERQRLNSSGDLGRLCGTMFKSPELQFWVCHNRLKRPQFGRINQRKSKPFFLVSLGSAWRKLPAQSRLPFVVDEIEIRVVTRPANALLAADFAPDARVDRREARVAFRLERDLRYGEAVGAVDRLGVELASASDDDRVCPHCRCALGSERERRLQTVGDQPPVWRKLRSRVRTMVSRPGSTRPIDWKVLRPMTSGLPIVSALNRLRSLDSRQRSLLSAPMTRLRATAATIQSGTRTARPHPAT